MVFLTHLAEVLRQNAQNFITRAETEKLIARVRESQPALVDELFPKTLVVRRSAARIAEPGPRARADPQRRSHPRSAGRPSAARLKDADLLTEHVRERLGSVICQQITDGRAEMQVLTFDSGVEQTISGAIRTIDEKAALVLDPRVAEQVLRKLSEETDRMARTNVRPGVVVPADRCGGTCAGSPSGWCRSLSVLSLNEVPGPCQPARLRRGEGMTAPVGTLVASGSIVRADGSPSRGRQGASAFEHLSIGQNLKLQVLRQLEQHRYEVAFGGRKHVVESRVPLSAGTQIEAQVEGKGDKLELRYLNAGPRFELPADASDASATAEGAAADATVPPWLNALAEQYRVSLDAQAKATIAQQALKAANPELMTRGGLFLQKLSQKVSPENLESLYRVLSSVVGSPGAGSLTTNLSPIDLEDLPDTEDFATSLADALDSQVAEQAGAGVSGVDGRCESRRRPRRRCAPRVAPAQPAGRGQRGLAIRHVAIAGRRSVDRARPGDVPRTRATRQPRFAQTPGDVARHYPFRPRSRGSPRGG